MSVWREVPTLAGRHVTLRPLAAEDREAFAAAASADPGPAERCDPPPGWDAVAARGTRYVLFGEIHGTAEAPAFVGDVACALAFRGERVLVAIEQRSRDNAAMQAAWKLPDDRFAAALLQIGWRGRDDGVGSEAMAALLRRLHRLREGGRPIDLVLFNPDASEETRFAALPGQGPHEAAQAETIRRADAGAHDHVLVLTGNLHAGKRTVMRDGVTFEPMAMRLAPAAAVTSLEFTTAGGTFWGCQIRDDYAFAPGKPLPGDAIQCAAHALKATATLTALPAMGLGTAPGAAPDPAYDGWFWLGRVTASPPFRR